MKRKSIAAALWSALAWASLATAQTAQTVLLRAVMSPSMSPASGDSGVTDVLVHTVKDSSGNILSGSLDLNFAYQFPNDNIVTDLGIACGPAGVVAAIAPVQAAAGAGRISTQVQAIPRSVTIL